MKPPPFEYVAPATLDEALQALADSSGDARPLAGGQSLVPMLNFRLAGPPCLVDLNRIAELAFVREGEGGGLEIGAMTRQRALERHPLIAQRAPLLAEAAPWIAHPQIRARGTIGGSVAHADPAAELPALLLALGATLRAARAPRDGEAGARVERRIALDELFLGPFFTVLEPEELVVSIEVPPGVPGQGTAFEELARRRGDYAIAGVAARVRLDPDGTCVDAALAFVNAGPTPGLAPEATARLIGRPATPEHIDETARAAGEVCDPAADMHGSERYRRHLVRVLTRRTLLRAVGRARERLA